jgi:mono/diheme cytochrome c family protein
MRRHSILAGFSLVIAAVAVIASSAAENEAAPAGSSGAAVSNVEVKKLFANNCSWCHGSYGMTAEKGPRLAGTTMTEEEVRERIRHGKEGYMPPFASVLSEQQIAAFAKYIKSLVPTD